MSTTPINDASTERFDFRRLIRFSIGVQVLIIALLLGATLWGALQTRSRSDDLARTTKNLLYVSGLNQEFARSRVALRQYVHSGSPFSLGAFTQSRKQISTIAIVLESGLQGANRLAAERLVNSSIRYFETVGDAAVAEVQRGRPAAARKILSSDSASEQLRAITVKNGRLSQRLEDAQTDADEAVSRRQELNALLIVLSGLVILASGIGVLLWIRRETMVPLENLAIASRKLGHGDLSARVEPGGVAEVALTGRAFNQMADEIERHVGQLHELSVARSRFVSSVSHELRTPITSLRGYLDLLAKGEAGELSPEQARIISVAERNANQLSELIDDLLTLSRVQSGRLGLRQDAVNLRELLHDLKTEMLPIGSDRGIDVVLVDTGDLVVRGDAMRLRQAFGNLLGNAIKYSRDGQAVVVRALAVDRQAVVSFVDWGIGIAREDLPQIAEPFFRSEGTDVPGTGLGLAIVKQMVELHGGRLAVESELGTGSTFTVFLPLDRPLADPPGDVPVETSATTTGN